MQRDVATQSALHRIECGGRCHTHAAGTHRGLHAAAAQAFGSATHSAQHCGRSSGRGSTRRSTSADSIAACEGVRGRTSHGRRCSRSAASRRCTACGCTRRSAARGRRSCSTPVCGASSMHSCPSLPPSCPPLPGVASSSPARTLGRSAQPLGLVQICACQHFPLDSWRTLGGVRRRLTGWRPRGKAAQVTRTTASQQRAASALGRGVTVSLNAESYSPLRDSSVS